jgi:hypothetical protein
MEEMKQGKSEAVIYVPPPEGDENEPKIDR